MKQSYQAMTLIEKQLSKASNLNNSHLTRITEPMKEKFLKYWHTMQELAAIGLVLDPCYKICYLQFSLQEMHNSEEATQVVSKVKEAMIGLAEIYTPPSPTSNNVPGAELNLYLEERNFSITGNKKIDILAWWKVNVSQFPTISKLTQVILMAPVTSVALESAFSTGGRVLDNYQSQLNKDTSEALLCLIG
jgi:hypothetical protein